MNEISVIEKQLPDSIEELSKFVFYGREKLVALKAAIKASTKANVVTDALEKMKADEQGLAEAVLLGEAKIGELLQSVPQIHKGRNSTEGQQCPSETTKQSIKSEIGISDKQAQRYQTLAKHPDLVEEAIEEAKANHRAVTRADVMKKISPPEKVSKTKEYWKAKEAHQEYQEEKKNGVLNFENAKADKQNLKIIAKNFTEEMNVALFKIEKIAAWKSEELGSTIKTLDKETKLEIAKRISRATKVLCYIGEELIIEKK